MNKFFSLMAVVLAAATVFTSCKKDDNNSGFPATLDGCYGAYSDGTFQSLWIGGGHGEFAIYDSQTFKTLLKIEGDYDYDPSTGKAYVTSYVNRVDIQARKGINAGKLTVTYTEYVDPDPHTYELTVLIPVGFDAGSWVATQPVPKSDSTYRFDLNVKSLTEGTFSCVRYMPDVEEGDTTEVFNFNLKQIYGFYQIGEYLEKQSVGYMDFAYGTETMSVLGYRNNNTSLTMVIDEDDYFRTLVLDKKQDK